MMGCVWRSTMNWVSYVTARQDIVELIVKVRQRHFFFNDVNNTHMCTRNDVDKHCKTIAKECLVVLSTIVDSYPESAVA